MSTRSLSVGFIPSSRAAVLVAAAMAACSATSAIGQLHLTPEGITRFGPNGLTTFASGFPSSGSVGPLAIDYQADGSILISSYADATIRRFNNSDNQAFAGAQLLSYPASEFAHGIAHIGSTVFVSRYNSQSIVELNANGSINRTVATGLGNARALLTNPATGRLLVTTVTGVRDVNPATGALTTITTDEADGLSLSPDGSTMYGAIISGPRAGRLVGYSVSTGQIVFNAGPVAGGIDGTALGFGLTFTGLIYANLNNGTVLEFNLSSPSTPPVTIATGGSRGDFVSADPTGSGDLLLTQTDRVMRLRGIPTPSAAALLGLGGLLASRRRR